MSFRIGDSGKIDPALLAGKGSRNDGRAPNQLRPVTITPRYSKHAEGSALIDVGDTRVLCTASLEDRVPPFLKGRGEGWVTAEYGMLPRSTTTRTQREASRGHPSGRTYEIQRLIGRSLRAVIDLKSLGERTVWVDCDVIQADGGTRTASITGAFVAVLEALRKLKKQGAFADLPVYDFVAATSVGKKGEELRLDLNYEEDSSADVDMNVVKTSSGGFIELQGTAEAAPFSTEEMAALLALADAGLSELFEIQRKALGGDVALKKRRR